MSLTEEKKLQVAEMYQAGVHTHEIMNTFHITGDMLYSILKEYSVEKRRGSYNRTSEQPSSPPQKKAPKTKRCPHCKASINPNKAKFCCMCGQDIRSEADILAERLDKAMTLCIKLLPQSSLDEVVSAMRDAKKIIEKQK